MVRDHDEIYDELLEEEGKDQQKKQSKEKEKEVEGVEKLTFPPKKAKSVVKIAALRKGGSVSSASKRADGIATKGKTKGKMI
jgi:hypothetical protein